MSGLGVALISAVVAVVGVILGFIVNRRSVAVVELEAALKRVVVEVGELRARLVEVEHENDQLRVDRRQTLAHMDALQEELDKLRKAMA